MKQKNKRGFLGMLQDTLGASLSGNFLSSKEAMAASQGCKAKMPRRDIYRAIETTARAGGWTTRADQDL